MADYTLIMQYVKIWERKQGKGGRNKGFAEKSRVKKFGVLYKNRKKIR
jgi:hypothetical protein